MTSRGTEWSTRKASVNRRQEWQQGGKMAGGGREGGRLAGAGRRDGRGRDEE